GSLVALAIAHYAVILGATLIYAHRQYESQHETHPLTARYLSASLVYVCLVVCLGLTVALNLAFGFLGAGTDRLLLAHITLGVVGWLTCTLIHNPRCYRK